MSINKLYKKHLQKEKVACLTAYDANFATLLDQAGIDLILVGDSLATIIQGKKDTLGVSVKQMVYHTECVRAGVNDAVVMSDMPFLSYSNPKQALKNAGKLLHAGAEIVKLEGDQSIAPVVECLSRNFIPVCAHIGLKPQQIRQLGGYYMHGKDAASRRQILADAHALKNAGARIILLECVDPEVTKLVTEETQLLTIGIGSGNVCGGQILVLNDILGITDHSPTFSKNFLTENTSIQKAIDAYIRAVKNDQFPS